MNILTFDLGSVTGWACVTETGRVVKSGKYSDADFWHATDGLRQKYQPKIVVVEEPLIIHGPLGSTLRRVAEEFKIIFPNAVYVRPSDWKPHPMSKEKLPDVKSLHERDAIHIGLWYVKVRLQGSD